MKFWHGEYFYMSCLFGYLFKVFIFVNVKNVNGHVNKGNL